MTSIVIRIVHTVQSAKRPLDSRKINDDLHKSGPELSRVHLYSMLLDTFRGLWTKQWFYGEREASLCILC